MRFIYLPSIIWIGGTISGALLVAFGDETSRSAVAASFRSVVQRAINPAMVVAWLAGLAVLLDGWSVLYARAGWMHGKLTLALIVSGLTGVLSGRLRRAGNNPAAASPSVFRAFALGFVLIATLVITLAKFKFGS